ncbi:MAG TPA: VCBS repeat-containing protein [Blastocatellia bacterium]|nr:VCBS repeat-containing protein [Blastocatellia bacterium]
MTKQGLRVQVGLVLALILTFSLPLAAIRVTAQGASIQLAVDTANTDQDGLLVIFGGLIEQGEIGLPVAAGDINGDGRADVVFCGMFGSTNFRTNNGVVNFYLSDGRDTGIVNGAQNPPSIFRLSGQRSGDLLGTSVSANGDINGDGIRDVVIGAGGQDGPNGGIADNRGAAYVVFGSHNFNGNIDLNDSTPPPGVIAIYGPQAGGRMGIWCDAGDIDGDGFADIVIGSDQINSPTQNHLGGAYIVFGAANLPSVIDLAAPPAGVRTAKIVGANEEDHWGAALQVGDLNNDGIGDIIIGGSIDRDSGSYVTPNLSNGHNFFAASFGGQRPLCGEVFVIYGQHNWPALTDLHNPPANATHVIGANGSDFLGSQLHSGDINGDGRTDLIIGALLARAPIEDNIGQTGGVFVVYGSPTLPGATIDLANPDASGQKVTSIYGEHNLDCAGDSVRTYDINKDGMSDLFIGSPERTFEVNGEEREDAGTTEIIFGQRDFLPAVIKLYAPPVSPKIFRLAGAHGELQGIAGGDEFSYRLAGADVDGDGYIDYVANAMHGDGAANAIRNGGNVYVFSGRKLSEKLGMIAPQKPPAPAIASATLLLNGQVVQQANAGQAGLRIKLSGTQFRADTEVSINGQVVVSHLQATPPASPDIFVELDENSAIRNSAGQLLVRARNTNPIASDLSNEISAGQLVGPVITRVKVKKKASGALLLNITGTGFPSTGTITVFANDSQLALQSTSFEPPDFAQAKLAPGTSPTPGTTMRIRLITPQGIQSNEVTATSK